jgi:hypothetical protein
MGLKCEEPKIISGTAGRLPSPALAQKAGEAAIKKLVTNFKCPKECGHLRVISRSITVIGHYRSYAERKEPVRFSWDASWEVVLVCQSRIQIEEG